MSLESTNSVNLGTQAIDISALDEFLGTAPSSTNPTTIKVDPIVNTENQKVLNLDDINKQLMEDEPFKDPLIKDESQETVISPKSTAIIPDVTNNEVLNESDTSINTSINQDEIFAELGNGLVKMGKLDALPENVKWTQDTFLQALDERIENGAGELLSNTIEGIENGEALFKALFIDKVNPNEYLKLQSEVIDYVNVDLNLETNQERIISKFLEMQGNDEEQIEEYLDFCKDKDKLKETALKAQKKLIERTTSEQNALAAKKEVENQRIEAQKKQFIADLHKVATNAVKEKELDGLPINDKQARELIEYATRPAYKRKDNGQELTEFDVAFMEMKKDSSKFLKLAMLLKNDLNLESAVKRQVSKQTNSIFNFGKANQSINTKDSQKDPFVSLFKK